MFMSSKFSNFKCSISSPTSSNEAISSEPDESFNEIATEGSILDVNEDLRFKSNLLSNIYPNVYLFMLLNFELKC